MAATPFQQKEVQVGNVRPLQQFWTASPQSSGPSHLEFQSTLSEMVVFLPPVFVPDAEVQACLGTAGG